MLKRMFAIVLAAALVAGACSSDDEATDDAAVTTTEQSTEEPTTEATAAEETATEEAGAVSSDLDLAATYRFAYPVGPATFDPHKAVSSFFNTALFLSYDRLVHQAPDTSPIPGLATDWTYSDDGTELELILREGVTFHDGEPFDAAAVKANLERAKTVEGSVVRGDLASVDSVEVVDDRTVRLLLSRPDAALIGALQDRAGAMISPAAFDNTDLDVQPVGAGMYEVVGFEPGTKIDYSRYAEYWDAEAAAAEEFEFFVVLDGNARLNMLRTDQIDQMHGAAIDARPAQDAGLDVILGPTIASWGLLFNRSRPPFDDVRIRQAVNYALDREGLVEGLNSGVGRVDVQPVPEGHWAHDPDTGTDFYTRDLDMARQLLADAGFEDGLSFTAVVATSPFFVAFAEALQAQLAEVGIDVELMTVDALQAGPIFYGGEGDASIGTWGGTPDPSQTVQALYTADGFANPGGHTTDAITELYGQSLVPASLEERQAVMQELMAEITAEAMGAVAFFQDTVHVLGPCVAGFENYELAKPEFRGTGIAAGCR